MTTFSIRDDKREFGRRTTRLGGWIKVKGRPPIPCRVENVSEGGALISLPQAMLLPRRFTLRIDTGSIEHLCEVRHGDGLQIGVVFVVAEALAAVDSSAVRELEAFARTVPWGQDGY